MATSTRDTVKPASRLAGKYLSFHLGTGRYAMGVLRVREIIRPTTYTATPGMPEHFLGVINLRGRIIPVADLRLRFGLGQPEDREKACIIISELQTPDGEHLPLGLLVDAVDEVLSLSADEVEEPPRFGAGLDTGHLLGMAKTKGPVTALLDVDRLFAGAELSAIRTVHAG